MRRDRQEASLETTATRGSAPATPLVSGLADLAHEYGNVLMGIRGCTEMALRQLPEDAPAAGYVQAARRAAERATELADQLHDFSPYEGHRVVIIEPERHVRSALLQLVERHGCTGIDASDARQAAVRLSHSTRGVDLVLARLALTSLAHGQLAQWVRAHCGGAPLLLLSGSSADAILEQVWCALGLVTGPRSNGSRESSRAPRTISRSTPPAQSFQGPRRRYVACQSLPCQSPEAGGADERAATRATPEHDDEDHPGGASHDRSGRR